MRSDEILEELERAADKVGVRVSYETLGGDTFGPGGLCKVKGEWRVIIDRRASASEKVSLLAQALRRFDLDPVYLSPEVRQIVERQPRPAPVPPVKTE